MTEHNQVSVMTQRLLDLADILAEYFDFVGNYMKGGGEISETLRQKWLEQEAKFVDRVRKP